MQLRQQESVEYIRRSVDFIRQIKQLRQVESRESTELKFILSDVAVSLNSNNCLQQVLADKLFYSEAELTFIEGHAASRYQWQKTDFPSVKFVKEDTIKAVFRKAFASDRWGYFHEHIGRDFNEFSMPVFIRNNTFCLFYSANYCGDLCAEGSLRLYKKEGAHWKLVKSYCDWIS